MWFFNKRKIYTSFLISKNKIKVLEIVKKENNYTPNYWNEFNFNFQWNKYERIENFKKIKKILKTNKIFLYLDNINIKPETIVDELKITGFKVQLINSDVDYNLFFSKNNTDQETIFIFQKKMEIIFLIKENNQIIQKVKWNTVEEMKEKIQKFFPKSQTTVYIAGSNEKTFLELKEWFFKKEKTLKLFNPWINILNLNQELPKMTLTESQNFIENLGVIFAGINYNWAKNSDIQVIKKEEVENVQKEKKEKNKENAGQKEKHNKEAQEVKNKREEVKKNNFLFWEEIKKEFKNSIFGIPFRENTLKEKKKGFKNIFLPKPKKIFFLPKRKKK